MNRNILASALCLLGLVSMSIQEKCIVPLPEIETLWQNQNDECVKLLVKQINTELTASITYLSMSAHFSSAEKFRPGMAKFFLASAVEEREHAKKVIDYLLLRGYEDTPTIGNIKADKVSWKSLTEAIQDAANLERTVTNAITEIIKECEKSDDVPVKKHNDYHTVDYFTSDFLAEQHDSLRQLNGFLATLKRMEGQPLAEILFDKTISAE